MRRKLILVVSLIATWPGAAQIKSASANNGDFRSNYAKVFRVLPNQLLNVRSGPRENSPVIAHLRLDQPVYVCDESGEWLRVF